MHLHQHSTKNRTSRVGQVFHILGDGATIHIDTSKQQIALVLQISADSSISYI